MNVVLAKATRPRVLFISPVVPGLGGNGLAMRCGAFLDAAAQVGDVDLLVASIGEPVSARNAAFASARATRFIVVEGNYRSDTLMKLILEMPTGSERLARFRNYGRPRICRNYSSPVLRDVAAAVSGCEYDLVVVMRTTSLPVFELAKSTAKLGRIIWDLDDDDIEITSEIAIGHAKMGNDELATLTAAETDIFHDFIDRIGRLSDVCLLANPAVLETVESRHQFRNLAIIPNSVALSAARHPKSRVRAVMVGNLQYFPNYEGVLWFLEHVLNQVRAAVPDFELTIAGSWPSDLLLEVADRHNVEVVSNIPDISEIYSDASFAIVPLLSGSGTRIKILEAGAHGIPVVSTYKGAAGLGLQDGVHGWLTESDPKQFARACIDVLQNASECEVRGLNLMAHVEQHFERSNTLSKISELFRQTLEGADTTSEA